MDSLLPSNLYYTLFYLLQRSPTASVILKELANELVTGWLEVAHDALSGRISCQYTEYY
jgi:hypothetical protein